MKNIKLFKIEGLTLRIYGSSRWRCPRKKVSLKTGLAISKNFLKITIKLPCESVVKIREK